MFLCPNRDLVDLLVVGVSNFMIVLLLAIESHPKTILVTVLISGSILRGDYLIKISRLFSVFEINHMLLKEVNSTIFWVSILRQLSAW